MWFGGTDANGGAAPVSLAVVQEALAAGPPPDRPYQEEVSLLTGDGVRLAARHWRQSDQPKATVVVAHGFAANQDHRDVVSIAADLHSEGFGVITYDARGHGRSEGRCTVGDTERFDVQAAHTSADAQGAPVVLLGISMGAIAVLRHMAGSEMAGPAETVEPAGPAEAVEPAGLEVPPTRPTAAGIVLVSAPARWRMKLSPVALGALMLTRTRVGRKFAQRSLGVQVMPGWSIGQSPLSLIDQVHVPVAVIHGSRDRIIRPSQARLLFAGAPEPRSLDVVADMGHGIDSAGGRRAACDAVEWVAALGHQVSSGQVSSGQVSPTTTPTR